MSEAGHMESTRDPPASPVEAAASASVSVNVVSASEKPFPMNSKRLTGPYLRCIAKAMELPTSGATDETRVMIDGKLAEMGCDPRDVQVIVRTDTHGQATVCLRDTGGVFVDAGTLEERLEITGDSVDGGEREGLDAPRT